MEKNNYIEKLESRFNKAFSELPYAKNVEYYNTFKMLFAWWLYSEDTEKKFEVLKKANSTDFLDFLAATSIVISHIRNGKTEFDFDNKQKMKGFANDNNGKLVPASRLYDEIDGIAISKSNKMIYEYTLDLIDYIYACFNVEAFNSTGAIVFNKYEEK